MVLLILLGEEREVAGINYMATHAQGHKLTFCKHCRRNTFFEVTEQRRWF